MPRIFLLFFLVLLLVSCGKGVGRKEHSFYYWQRSFEGQDSVGKAMMKKFNVRHFYVKYFDVDWNEKQMMPLPLAGLWAYSGAYNTQTYTPVVCITNRAFQRMSDDWADSLAIKVSKAIARIKESDEQRTANSIAYDSLALHDYSYRYIDSLKPVIAKRLHANCTEIQIDCDWTEGTKKKYFRFLKKMKEHNPALRLSVTLRLYPYKYYKRMGVPPADRAVLMCYNMGNIRDVNTTNSIFDIKEMRKYLDGGRYPLALDVALPIFSWQAWYRAGHLKGIIHNEILPDRTSASFAITGAGTFRFNTDTVINDIYFREGDEMRTEAPDSRQLVQAADELLKKISPCNRIIFFDWNRQSINKYEDAIRQICDKY